MLNHDRLENFKRYVCGNKERQDSIQGIRLQVKLPEYDCSVCQSPEDATIAQVNDTIFLGTLSVLMNLLSAWDARPTRARCGGAFTLDLGVYSPSDGQHALRDFRLSETYRIGAGRDLYEAYEKSLEEDSHDEINQCPGWERTLNGKPLLLGAKKRLLATLCDANSEWVGELCKQHRIIQAPLVTALHIRRQYYRHISPHMLGRLLREGLPGLRSLRHETWAHPWSRGQSDYQHEYLDLIESAPLGLRRISLVYESSNALHYAPSPCDVDGAGGALGSRLAGLVQTQNIRYLNVSYIIDIVDLLRPNVPYFPKSEVLIVTAQKLRPWGREEFGVGVLNYGCISVLRHMPRLQTFQIWNKSNKHHFSLVLTGITSETITATWSSTWHPDDVLDEVWDALRLEMSKKWRHAGKTLIVKRETPPSAAQWDPGGLHLVSKRQIEYEQDGRDLCRGREVHFCL